MSHLLKLFGKICKYETDPASIVEDIDQTRFGLQTDKQTYRQTYGQCETSILPSSSLGRGMEVGGKIMALFTNE